MKKGGSEGKKRVSVGRGRMARKTLPFPVFKARSAKGQNLETERRGRSPGLCKKRENLTGKNSLKILLGPGSEGGPNICGGLKLLTGGFRKESCKKAVDLTQLPAWSAARKKTVAWERRWEYFQKAGE